MNRRDILVRMVGTLTGATALPSDAKSTSNAAGGMCTAWNQAFSGPIRRTDATCNGGRLFNGCYEGAHLENIAFPMGGIGAGMVCLEGNGALSHLSLWQGIETAREPSSFAAISIKGPQPVARVLEGPVPQRKRRPDFTFQTTRVVGAWWGLPRFKRASFSARFPFAHVKLSDDAVPLSVNLTGWSPFEPNDPDNASLPVAGLEYEFVNDSRGTVEGVFSFNAANFMDGDIASIFVSSDKQAHKGIREIEGGFELFGTSVKDEPWRAGSFAIWVDDPTVKVNAAWLDVAGADEAHTLAWRDVENAACFSRAASGEAVSGASLFVPLRLAPHERRTVAVRFAWFVKKSNLKRNGSGALTWVLGQEEEEPEDETFKPWYVGRFTDITSVTAYWRENYRQLRINSERFSRAFYDSTLPPEVLEAVAANLTILKSPTVLRQEDGRFWAWEGSFERHWITTEGTNTHVWNYAQALPHLFPSLERTIRETEFGPNQREDGHQDFRGALPIRPTRHTFLAAADGQLGGVIKIYRDWRISGDTEWLRQLWPRVRTSLDYCIRTWDPNHSGWLEEPHHNTFDVEFWGPDGMCTSFYLGALQAAVLIAKNLDEDAGLYAELLKKGARRTEDELFNGEYFIQRVRWRDLKARYPLPIGYGGATKALSPETVALVDREGPPHQYGMGCLSCGVAGSWLALICGVGHVLSASKVRSHLQSVHRYNLKQDLSAHANTEGWMRPSFAFGDEGGLISCTWPKGGRPTVPFATAGEVWTGFEYSVASHLMLMGSVEEGLEIVRTCRARYDGRFRNPFDEVEAGHWYARALSSYSLLQALSGARFDAVERVLYLNPTVKGDFRCFLSTATGYGTVGVLNGAPFVEVASGNISYSRIEYTPA